MNKATKGDTPGARIRAARDRLQLTAAVMAKRIRISRGYLSELENDKSEASDKVLRAMEVELDVNPDYIRRGMLPVLFSLKKFGSEGKQVSQSAAGGAQAEMNPGGGGPVAREPLPLYQPAGPPRLDAIRTVVAVVGEQLEARGLRLPPAKFADLVVLIYEHLASEDADEERITETAKRYLRLVA